MEATLNKTLPFLFLKAFVTNVIFHHDSAKQRGEGTSQTPPLLTFSSPSNSLELVNVRSLKAAPQNKHTNNLLTHQHLDKAWENLNKQPRSAGLSPQPEGVSFPAWRTEQGLINPMLQSPVSTEIMSWISLKVQLSGLRENTSEKTNLLLPAVS